MPSKHVSILLLILMLTSHSGNLQAQDVGDLNEGGQLGLFNEAMPSIGTLLPVDDLISDGEDLATESVPSFGAVPVDGGLSLLLAAGAAYGARRLRRRKQD